MVITVFGITGYQRHCGLPQVSQLGHLQVKGPWTGAVCPVPHVASKVPTQGVYRGPARV